MIRGIFIGSQEGIARRAQCWARSGLSRLLIVLARAYDGEWNSDPRVRPEAKGRMGLLDGIQLLQPPGQQRTGTGGRFIGLPTPNEMALAVRGQLIHRRGGMWSYLQRSLFLARRDRLGK